MEIGSKSAGETGKAGRIYELIAGHPSLDLVNTLDWRFREGAPEEFLTTYNDLLRFTEQSGMITAAQGRRLMRSVPENKAEKIVAAVRELREAAAQVLYAALDGDGLPATSIKKLEAWFKEAKEHRELRWDGSKLAWDLPQSPAPHALPLWLLCLSTAEFLTSSQMQLVRACGDPECRWLFVDTSKNHTRRWCDMKVCGNRMKARRFKAQHRA